MPGYTRNIARLTSAPAGFPMNKPPGLQALDFGQIQILSHPGSTGNSEDTTMPELLDSKDVVEFKELLMANTIQIDAMYHLLILIGFFTEAEYLAKMKEVQMGYHKAVQQ